MTNDAILTLDENYEFELNIELDGHRFAGILSLNQKKISIKILGENSDDRKCNLNIDRLKTLKGSNNTTTFFMYNLKHTSSKFKIVEWSPKCIQFFEYNFEIEYIITSPHDGIANDSFTTFQIFSETLQSWVGNTTTQKNILFSNNRDDLNLFEYVDEVKTGKKGFEFSIYYNLKLFHSIYDNQSGKEFPASFNFSYNEPIDGHVLKTEYNNVYNLFAVLTGDELEINKVHVIYNNPQYHFIGSLYYPIKKNTKRNNSILFPFGKDLQHDTRNLPSTPLVVFQKFFNLNQLNSGYFKKYVKYRRIKMVEERFLGFFRLLESLCYKEARILDENHLKNVCVKIKPILLEEFEEKDKKNINKFIKGLARYNKSKYNTEKCLLDFYKEMPENIKNKWTFSKGDFNKICKLRNDLTHANDHDETEINIIKMTKFIEMLLVFKLFEVVGIDLSTTSKIIHLLNGYHLLNKELFEQTEK